MTLSAILLALTALFAAQTDTALTSRESRVEKALEELTARAGAGEPQALYDLGTFYERGYGSVPPDTARALSLFARAADAGWAAAQNYYGFLLFNGTSGLERDRSRGLDYIEKAALQGFPTASANLGWLLANGDGVERDYAKARYWLSRAVEEGSPAAMCHLADLCRDGLGEPHDTLRATQLYDDALAAGFHDAEPRLMQMMKERWSRLEPAEATQLGRRYYISGAPGIGVWLLEKGASAEIPEALALLADATSRAYGTPYDHDRSVRLYYRAAELGNAPAQFVISELLEMFPDALADIPGADADAHAWAARAAAAGVTDAAAATRLLLTPAP